MISVDVEILEGLLERPRAGREGVLPERLRLEQGLPGRGRRRRTVPGFPLPPLNSVSSLASGQSTHAVRRSPINVPHAGSRRTTKWCRTTRSRRARTSWSGRRTLRGATTSASRSPTPSGSRRTRATSPPRSAPRTSAGNASERR